MTRASLREYAAKQRERYQGGHPSREASAVGRGRGRDRHPPQSGHPAAPPRPAAPGPAGARRPPARVRPGGGHRRRGPLAGQRADRRPPAPALRAGAPGPPPPVRGAHARPGGRQARAPGQPAHPRAAAGPRPGPVPAARRHDHAARHRPPARDPDPHLHRVDRCPAGLPGGRSRRALWRQAPRASISAPSARWTSPPRGSSWSPSGARARTASAAPSTTSGRACPCPWSAWTATTAPSSSTAALRDYCRRHGITFTRSRPWKKNDSAHVEQKNGAVVRQLVGYDRFASRAAYAANSPASIASPACT